MSAYLSKFLYVLPAGKRSLVMLVVLFLLVSLLEVFGIGSIGPFISLASNPQTISQTPWLHQIYLQTGFQNETHFLGFLGLLIVAIFILKSYVHWRVNVHIFRFSFQQRAELCRQLLQAYLEAPYSFHLSNSSAKSIQNVIQFTGQFSGTILITFLVELSNLTIVLFLTALLFIANSIAVVMVLSILLPLLLLFHHFRQKIKQWGQEVGEANASMIRIVNHSLGSIKETRIIGCEPHFQGQISQQANRLADAMTGFFSFKILPRLMIETMLVLGLVGFTSISLIVYQNLESLLPVLGIFTVASLRMVPAITGLVKGASTLRNSTYTLDRLYLEFKEIESFQKEAVSQFSVAMNTRSRENYQKKNLTFRDRIVLDGVSYRYPEANEHALSDISLTLQKGESIAFIGKSGAGKTTLVDVILGLLLPQQGDIQVDDTSIYQNLRSWQNLIAYIPQSIYLIDDTIERNIAFGVPDEAIDGEKVEKAIQAAQLQDLIAELPEGMKTSVGERGVRLSGGQRQRIGIARAIYHDRPILILDEATSALDNETENLVSEAIESLAGVKTTIAIAHRLSTIQNCDRIYLMEKGKIVKSGTYQEVVEATNEVENAVNNSA
ncbi:ABC transporter ATP-binding protein [Geitlerinema sp. PCC 9228]|uniref:ABC transporter ATP-binding protein n=1 Tax=Geitlerinema sp. PCC 9228 TaxID=111611 RepID=UPI000B1F94A9|nr:ABC transporter ATP-binding protein [Geitlerinema sp. PCC 9228]